MNKQNISACGYQACCKGHKCNVVDRAQVELCKVYLQEFRATKKVYSSSPGSYGLKHRVERYYKARGMEVYVSNGALITAALELYLPVKQNELNAFIGLHKYANRPLPSEPKPWLLYR